MKKSNSVDANYNFNKRWYRLSSNMYLFLALMRKVWITDFPVMGSDGTESLGKSLILYDINAVSGE